MKRIAICLAALLGAALSGAPAWADYPDKPIKLVVPYPPGGTSDVLGRLLGQRMGELLGQPVVVDNKPGAAETVGANFVAKSTADGYTLLLSTMTTLAINPTLYGSKLAYDPQRDLVAVNHLVNVPAVVAVNPAVPVKTMAELQAYLKAKPDRNYASPGVGTPNHLGTELYKRAAGVSVMHVPYRGGAPAVQDLMAGQVDMMLVLTPEAMPLAKAGKLRVLAVTSAQRSPMAPELPTAAEAGVKDFELVVWYALIAPAATPKDVLRKVNAAMNDVLADRQIRAKLAELSIDPVGGSMESAASFVASESAKWKRVIEQANIKPE